MCGILAYFGRKISKEEFAKALNTLSHRGPDDEGIEEIELDNETLFLGHERLSIIDLSPLAHQPMSDDRGRVWITYNGEVYNFPDLKELLIQKGYVFKSKSDTEVMIYLYREYGTEMLHHLNGIFAFAIVDLDKKVIFAARDHFGIKPFYYYWDGGKFIFSSEIKAILRFDGIDKELSLHNLFNYFVFLYSPSPDTPFKQIKKLDPGHYLIFDLRDRNLKINCYWKWSDFLEQNLSLSEKDAIKALEEIFFKVMERQIISDVPVGFFLSGGLDSSTIVTTYKKIFKEERPHCFCISFKQKKGLDTNVDDVYYARKVAALNGAVLHEVEIKPDIVELLPDIVYYLDEPQGDPAIINVKLISAIARDRGFKVLLSGAGGDDIFTGYRRHQVIYLKSLFGWVPPLMTKPLHWMSEKIPMDSMFLRRIRKFLELFSLDMREAIIQSFDWLPRGSRFDLISDLCGYANPLSIRLEQVANRLDPIHQILYLESRGFLPDHNLNYTDKMGMCEGVEIRVPFLDKELAEFVGRLPARLKIRIGRTKYVLKKMMEKFLPNDIIYRPKVGFMAPLREWIRGDLRPLVKDYLLDSPPGFLDPRRVRALIEANENGHIDGAYTIYQLLVTIIWMQGFGVQL